MKQISGCTVALLFVPVLLLAAANVAIAGPAASQARLIEVPGTPAVLALWEEQDTRGNTVPFYGISLDGGDFVRTAPASYVLGLRYAHFDPLETTPTVAADLAADGAVNVYIVQFHTQPLAVFVEQIEGLGGAVRPYVAQHAYLVEMSPAARDAVAELPYVRWIGPYHPAYRMEEFLLDNYSSAGQAYPLQRYNIMVMETEQKYTVADRIHSIGGRIESPDAGKFLVEATLTPEQLFQVIRWDEVLFVDRWSEYEKDMNNIRVIGGANYIETVGGYTGAGVRGEVYDAGFNMGHHDFQSRPLIQHGSTGSDSHGSSTSGICFGDGAGQWIARGLLPDGQGIIADYNYTSMTGTGRYNNCAELVQAPYFAVFQTASVGSSRTAQYTTISADTDAMLFDFDIVFCQSQSNAGNQQSRPQAWAKNILSVGAAYHYDNTNMADDCWCGGASIGPATDNRIKPDLCQAYDATYTTSCCNYESYTSSFGGTSGATPIVAGHVGLLHQMWADGIFHNEVIPGGTVFENRPHMTTPKAMLIATAKQYDFSGLTHDKTRCHQGWGIPDLQTLYDERDRLYVVDQGDPLESFEISRHLVTVDAGQETFKAAMVYLDPAGNPSVQSQHRVNDLTLRVFSPSGAIYYGNSGLYENPWSSTTQPADTKNTVECVFVNSPEPGNWTIEIMADELVDDGYVATPEWDAVYSLAVLGGVGQDWSAAEEPRFAASARLDLRLLSADRNGSQRLAYAVPSESAVRLTVHDVTGRLVATLVDGRSTAGDHEAVWSGDDAAGLRVQPGVYFARLSADGQEASRKLLIAK